jgi:hypothetical protein
MILYLKTTSRAALIDALIEAGMWHEVEGVAMFKSAHPGDALVDIGTIYTGTGQFIEIDGMQVEQQVAIEGYHANLMLHGEVPEVLEAISIPRPGNPRNVFAGAG